MRPIGFPTISDGQMLKSRPGEVLAQGFHCGQFDPSQWQHTWKMIRPLSKIISWSKLSNWTSSMHKNLSPSRSSVDEGGRHRGARLDGAGRGSLSRAARLIMIVVVVMIGWRALDTGQHQKFWQQQKIYFLHKIAHIYPILHNGFVRMKNTY